MIPINRKNERFYLKKVEIGHFEIDRDGTIYNTVSKREMNYLTTKGYIELACRDSKGKLRHILAHRLVWLALKGEIPDGMQINHKNGIKHDNRIKNLELVTASENIQHAYDTGLKVMTKKTREKISKSLTGQNHPDTFLKDGIIREMRRFHSKKKAQGWTTRKVARRIATKLGMGESTIRNILMGLAWTHVV